MASMPVVLAGASRWKAKALSVERAKPATATAYLPNRWAKEAESMITVMVVAVPTMLMMLLNTSATLELASWARSPWTM